MQMMIVDTVVYQIESKPNKVASDREGFNVYSLLKVGVKNDMKRTIVEKFLQLPIERILQDHVITSIPPWNVFLVLDGFGNYDILYVTT